MDEEGRKSVACGRWVMATLIRGCESEKEGAG